MTVIKPYHHILEDRPNILLTDTLNFFNLITVKLNINPNSIHNMSKQKLTTTFGSDPELFLFSNKSQKIVSSLPVLQHDKHDPIDLGDGIKMYADNVLVEAAMPPQDSAEGMLEQFKTVFQRMQNVLGADFRLVAQASHTLEDSELQDPKAWEAGCDPNFNAYTGGMNEPASFVTGLRSGSFHVHIGNKNFKKDANGLLLNSDSRETTIKLLDIFIGLSSIIFDGDESSAARRALYGKAGEFRPTFYGIEYRVLGNFALRSPETTGLVFDLINHALVHTSEGSDKDVIKAVGEKNVIKAINTNDVKTAIKLLTKAELPANLMKRVQKQYKPDMYKDWGIKA